MLFYSFVLKNISLALESYGAQIYKCLRGTQSVNPPLAGSLPNKLMERLNPINFFPFPVDVPWTLSNKRHLLLTHSQYEDIVPNKPGAKSVG